MLKTYLGYRMSSKSTLAGYLDIVSNYKVKRELRIQLVANSACLAHRKMEAQSLISQERSLWSRTTYKHLNTNIFRIF